MENVFFEVFNLELSEC